MIVRRIPRYREPVRCVHTGHAQMNIPDLIDGSITWQTHYHAAPIRKLRSWTNGFFKIVGFAGKRFLLSFPLPRHALFCARPNFPAAKKAKSALNVRKALPKRLLHRLLTVQQIQLGPPEVFLPITRRVQNKRIGVTVSFGPITIGVKFNSFEWELLWRALQNVKCCSFGSMTRQTKKNKQKQGKNGKKY